MKIEKIIIENIKSFKDKTEINLNKDINIFIGPNRGGKSNFLDIMIITLRHFLVHHYRVVLDRQDGREIEDINKQEIFSPINDFLEKYSGNEQKDSFIEVAFTISNEDISNIKFLKENKKKLEETLQQFRGKPLNDLNELNSWNLTGFSDGLKVAYQIEDYKIVQPEDGPARTFLKYLNLYELFTILATKIEDFRLHPIFLYFPPYRMLTADNLIINLAGQNYNDLLLRYLKSTSKSTASLFSISAYYFSEKLRNYEIKGGEYKKSFRKDTEVKLATKFLKLLGYKWDLKCIRPKDNTYETILKRNGKELPIRNASSGEKEILNFLLGIFAYNIKNGLIIIDEPDLHLHPKWQLVLVDLFNKLSSQNKNQFLLVTHSPSFINEKTIDDVTRVYLDKNISKVVQPDKESLPGSKELLHLINTLNNEKIFFADKVILVEGLSDRILFQALVENYKKSSQEVIEVLDVQGKENLKKFRGFLSLFEIKNYIIADLDYVLNLENTEIKEVFITDYKEIDKDVIKNKKSKDAKSLSSHLKEIILDIKDKKFEEKKIDGLDKIWEYIESRHKKIKEDISIEERKRLNKFIESQKKEKIYILKYGEIEDYFPELSKNRNIESIIEFIKEKKLEEWVKQEEKEDKKEELKSIIFDILNRKKEKSKKLNSGKKINREKVVEAKDPKAVASLD